MSKKEISLKVNSGKIKVGSDDIHNSLKTTLNNHLLTFQLC